MLSPPEATLDPGLNHSEALRVDPVSTGVCGTACGPISNCSCQPPGHSILVTTRTEWGPRPHFSFWGARAWIQCLGRAETPLVIICQLLSGLLLYSDVIFA